MDAPQDFVVAEQVARPEHRSTPWIVRSVGSWSQLLLSLALVRVLAAMADFLPPGVLAMSWWDLGNFAVAGAALAGVGLLASIVFWRRVGSLRRLWLMTLVGLHAGTLAVFPTDWLLASLQTNEIVFYIETDRPVFALTIDDGLDPAVTPLILDTLARHDAKATFFVLGQSILDHPGLADRCLAEGHELANHQMTDTPAIALDASELERHVLETHEALIEITEPRWFRPGGGIVTERAVEVSRRLGYRVALGSVFPIDPYQTSARFSAAYVAGRTGPGQIVVFHDVGERGERTAQALEKALPQLAERGLSAVTLRELAAE